MTHAQLRAFHAVATERSFTKAARLLRVSQPAVTFQVKALEESCGAVLLDRRGREVVPTELGEELFETTRRIFRAIFHGDTVAGYSFVSARIEFR